MPEKKDENLPPEYKKALDILRAARPEEQLFTKRFRENIEAAGGNPQRISEAIIKYANSIQVNVDSIAKNLKRSGTMNDRKTDDNDYFIDQCLNKMEIELMRHKQNITESSIEEIDNDLLIEFENIFLELKEFSGSRPEKLVSVALSSVNSLERKHFLLSNLLESLKKGNNYYDTLRRFNDLGITNIKIPEQEKEKEDNIYGKGSSILASMKSLKKFALTLYQVIINSIKSIPDFIKLKPRVGVSGIFPSISFEIEGSSVTIQKFYELLSKSA